MAYMSKGRIHAASVLCGISSFSPPFVAFSEISACAKGNLDPVTLQNNYSYVIEK